MKKIICFLLLCLPALAAQSVPCGTGAVPIASGITGLIFTDTTVVDGSTYYYDLTATDANGLTSGCSAVVGPKVIPSTGAHTVTVTWNASTGGTPPYTYAVFRAQSPSPPSGVSATVN